MRRFVLFFLMGVTLLSCAPVIKVPGPSLVEPRIDESGAVIAADGARLPLRSWLPPPGENNGRPRAVVVALHGMNDYSNAFDGPGTYLASQGVAVFAYDQRGFGQSPEWGYWPGIGALTDDAALVLRLVAAKYPGVPEYLLGESMGGAVAMLTVAGSHPPPVRGVILSAPAVWDRGDMNVFQRGLLWLSSHTLPWLKLSGSGLGIRPSDNDAMLLALSRDPLVIKSTRVDVIHGVCDLMDAAQEAAPRIAVPALVLYGAHDQIVPAEPSYRMMNSLSDRPGTKARAVYAHGWHMLLRDREAKVVLDDILAWIGHPGQPLPSGADVRARAILAKAGGE